VFNVVLKAAGVLAQIYIYIYILPTARQAERDILVDSFFAAKLQLPVK